jgi:6-pyruvoyl-tetrahydropterin synthase
MKGLMFRLEFTYRFETAHRFTKGNSKCSTPHGHTWMATLGFSAPPQVDAQEMVEEFETLKSAWRSFITETVDHSFLHHFQDPILSSLRDHIPGFRGLPFPGDPTTELIAALFLEKACSMRAGKGIKPSFVTIQETPTNRLNFGVEGLALIREKLALGKQFHGWWEDATPDSRRFSS